MKAGLTSSGGKGMGGVVIGSTGRRQQAFGTVSCGGFGIDAERLMPAGNCGSGGRGIETQGNDISPLPRLMPCIVSA
jgi:hypothetical protein